MKILEGEGMVVVEEVTGVGSRAQVERLALNSIATASFSQRRTAVMVVGT